jgi:hypothetical protein
MRRPFHLFLRFAFAAAPPLALSSIAAAAASGAAAARSPVVPAEWSAEVSAGLARAEYRFRGAGGADAPVSAPNRAHGLRVTVAPAGLVVEPRTPDGPRFRLELALCAVGRAGALRAAGAGRVAFRDERAELRRAGLVEWFVNEPGGLEHGVTLDGPRPDGTGLLELEYALGGDLLAAPAGPRGVALRGAAGRPVLTYAGLAVHDARGRELPARLRLAPGTLTIEIDDAGAAWPLRVDPLLTAAAWSADGGQAGAALGSAVAAAGDVDGDGFSDLLVGAPLYDPGAVDAGRALLFRGSAAGPSTTPDWTVDGTQAGAQFGAALAGAGDLNGDGFDDVAVAAPLHDGAPADAGRISAWYGSASGLAAVADWTFDGDQADAQWGRALAGAGDVDGDGDDELLAAAPLHDGGAADGGRVALFDGSPAGLGAAPARTLDGTQAGEEFGAALAGAADVDADGFDDVLIGAPRYDGPDADEGRAALYRGAPAGLAAAPSWTREADQAGARFGAALALAGDINGDGYADALAGAPGFDAGEIDEGRAFAFLGSAAGLGGAPAWTSESNQPGAEHGAAVAAAGDLDGDGFADALVGAPLFDGDAGAADSGRAAAFRGGAGGLAAAPFWTVTGDQPGEAFGRAVAGAGDVDGDGFADALTGAPGRDGGASDEGQAALYRGAGNAPPAAASWTADAKQPGAYFGYAVRGAGDVNGDGYADLAIGAYLYDGGQVDEGRAYLFLGSPSGPSVTPSWIFEADQAGAHLGVGISGAGDVDGDGYGDLAVGAPYFTNGAGQDREGRAWLFRGGPAGLAATPSWVGENDQFDSRFGVSVADAGDVNGDGYGDLAVGAVFFDDAGFPDAGRAYVYLGGPQGPGRAPAWIGDGERAVASYGFVVSGAGDVNGDGFDDVLVGARVWRGSFASEGRALVYYGSPTGPSPTPSWSFAGGRSGAEAGRSVAGAGDVNGDGYADLLVGATGYRNDLASEGRAFLFYGGPSGPSITPDWFVEGDQAGAALGAVAGAGDVDGDGFGDVLVGVRGWDGGQSDEGRALLYLGSATGPSTTPAWGAEADQAGALFGQSVAGVGDVNGDGMSDILVGAYLFDDPNTDSGRAFLWLGNGGDGLDRRLRQARADGSAPIAPGLASDAPAGFRARAFGRTPLGRGPVRLAWELKPQGTPLDGSGLGRSAFQDTGAPGASGSRFDGFDEPVPGLDLRRFAWRARLESRHPLAPRSPWLPAPFGPATTADLRGGGCILRPYYADADADGYGDAADAVDACAPPAGRVPFAADCNDADAGEWGVPGEVQFLRFTSSTALAWFEPGDRGGAAGAVGYDTLRAGDSRGFGAPFCVERDDAGDTVASDASSPPAGSGFFYLVRAVTACGTGTAGAASDGTPRAAGSCP